MNRFKPNIDRTLAKLAMDIHISQNLSKEESLRLVLKSDITRLLYDFETGLCYEMYETVYDMLKEELQIES